MTIRHLLLGAALTGLIFAGRAGVAQDAGSGGGKQGKPAASAAQASSDAQASEGNSGEQKSDQTKAADDNKTGEKKPAAEKSAGQLAKPKPDTSVTEEGTPAEEYAKQLAKWRELEEKLKATRQKFLDTPPTQRKAVLDEYEKLAEDAFLLVPKLRFRAIEAYKAAPNEDPQLVRMLIGMMADANRRDEYTAAREIGELLQAHKCQESAYGGQLGAALFALGEFEQAAPLLEAAEADEKTQTEFVKLCLLEKNLREAEAKADLPRVRLKTTKGDVVIELFENEAPGTVGNFINLVEKGFYNGIKFHRVLDGFMAQTGDPKGNGTGGPGYTIYDECKTKDHRNHFRGSVSMANTGAPNTGGSQFFITFVRTGHLDGKHTVFGRVIEGMEHVDALNRVNPEAPNPSVTPDKILQAEVIRKRDHAYEPVKVKTDE